MKALAPSLTLLFATLAGVAGTPPPDDIRPEFDAFTRPSRVVAIGSAVEGVLQDVAVRRGDRVERGQLLATLDLAVQQANADLAEARANQEAGIGRAELDFTRSERTYARIAQLFEEGLVSEEDRDAAHDAWQTAKWALVQARENNAVARLEHQRALRILEQGRITSPVDGVVVEELLSEGEIARSSGQEGILRVAQLDPLVLEVTAPILVYDTVGVGSNAKVSFHSHVKESHSAQVVAVDKVFDAASGTFRIVLELPNPDHAIPAGLRCSVRFGE